MTYREAIAEGRRLYAEAMDKAANYALFVVEEYERPLQTVCKEIAGDGWNALRVRASRMAKTAGQTPDQRALAARKEASTARRAHAKAALRDPEEAAKVIAALSDEALENVYHEARLVRAGEDRSPANRKAAAAAASNAVAPMKRAVATTHVALCVQALDEAAESLREVMAEDAVTAAALDRIERAYDRFATTLMEARMMGEKVTK
jgi:hypothetical protein